MRRLQVASCTDQVTSFLRAEIAAGRLRLKMPGVLKMESDLRVNRKAIQDALDKLEREGLLVSQGLGKPRLIVARPTSRAAPQRIALLEHHAEHRRAEYMLALHYELNRAGHACFHAPGTLMGLGMDLRRIARMVERTEADAWIVTAGSREVLEWFAARPVPCLALFGRSEGLPIAAVGPDKSTATAEAARTLLQLGHRRIVLLIREHHRKPRPGRVGRAFLDELAAAGLSPGEYNLPNWEETPEGLQALLTELFRHTPPTAILADEVLFLTATHHYLAGRGIRVPRDVSLVCLDPDPTFNWCVPSIAHVAWNPEPWVRSVLRWAATIRRGGRNTRRMLTPSQFITGGSIGPAPGGG